MAIQQNGGVEGAETPEAIALDADGSVTLPIVEVLTGRGFITGKSGSGKSNTASVVVEELLDAGYPVLIVDTDGEYYGLKEEYELLHAGADEECDIQIGPEHAEKLADLGLEQNVPVILDVSGYLDEEAADDLIRETAHHLFAKEKKRKQPFLLIVEEIHEYVPEGGGLDETGQMLIKVSKRGRKHGLGIVGISQRPADVKKDFITQANWLVWHRLTWENDTTVVRRVIDAEHADAVADLGDGEAFLQADFLDTAVRQVRVRRKRTFDAGATPDLDDFERPDLKSVSEDLLDDLQEISQRQRRREDRVDQLEERLATKDDRIADLEEELSRARDMQDMAEQFTDALTTSAAGGDADTAETIKAEVMEVREAKRELAEELEAVTAERDELAARVEELEAELADRAAAEDLQRLRDELQELYERHAGVLDVDGVDERVRERLERLQTENERLKRQDTANAATGDGLADMIHHEAIRSAVATAVDRNTKNYASEHFDRVLAILANADDGGPLTASEIAPLTDVSESTIRGVCKSLHKAGVVEVESDGRSKAYRLDREFLETRIEVAEQQARGDTDA